MESIFFSDSTSTPGIVYFCTTYKCSGAKLTDTAWQIMAKRSSDGFEAFANGVTSFDLQASQRTSYTYTFPS